MLNRAIVVFRVVKKFVDQRGPKFPVVGDVDPCWVSFSRGLL